MTMAASDLDMAFECSYSIGGMSDVPARCGNRAHYLVTWPREVTDQTTMTYCKVHFRAVGGFIDRADDVTVLLSGE